jgi:hypothetical protein
MQAHDHKPGHHPAGLPQRIFHNWQLAPTLKSQQTQMRRKRREAVSYASVAAQDEAHMKAYKL